MKLALKVSLLFTLLFTLLSCQDRELKVGECVQKPDSMIVWKIEGVEGETLRLSQDQNPQMEKEKTTSLSDSWVKTTCL